MQIVRCSSSVPSPPPIKPSNLGGDIHNKSLEVHSLYYLKAFLYLNGNPVKSLPILVRGFSLDDGRLGSGALLLGMIRMKNNVRKSQRFSMDA